MLLRRSVPALSRAAASAAASSAVLSSVLHRTAHARQPIAEVPAAVDLVHQPMVCRGVATGSEAAPLYDTHIPLSPFQRAAVAIGASVGALANPARADLVAAVGETTGGMALERIRQQMRGCAEGRALLEERPRVTDATLEAAELCGRGTFGAAYAHFMRSRSFLPHERPPVRFIDDPELAYVATRLREVHDFWHALFALPTTVSGELALKVIEFSQTGLPMCLLASLGAPIRLSPARRSLLLSSIYPWALGAGIRAVPLAGIFYERRFGDDMSDLRLEWRIAPAPPRFFEKTGVVAAPIAADSGSAGAGAGAVVGAGAGVGATAS
ncbi:hypothetical protein CLOP_g17763 [Closterium sp. NIES-67]|nr:hypothetical protein CLOP_g17763 [Closterium sp. NIES-67]